MVRLNVPLAVHGGSSAGLRLEKNIMYPSDYPHERPTLEEFLANIPNFLAREDLSDKVKKLILRDNCRDFYSLRM